MFHIIRGSIFLFVYQPSVLISSWSVNHRNFMTTSISLETYSQWLYTCVKLTVPSESMHEQAACHCCAPLFHIQTFWSFSFYFMFVCRIGFDESQKEIPSFLLCQHNSFVLSWPPPRYKWRVRVLWCKAHAIWKIWQCFWGNFASDAKQELNE
jgi:hypothetical protein